MSYGFANCHPIVNFIWFVIVILFAMFIMHPIFLLITCASGFSYYIFLHKGKNILRGLIFVFVIAGVAAIMNPLFNHQGMTLLFYFKNGNPVTLESVFYGLASGIMLMAVLLWFGCAGIIMSSDKSMYIFGKFVPAMSLVLSMTMQFIPKFRKQIKKVSRAQEGIGRDVTNGSVREKAGNGMKIFSIMMTWALENSVDTADTMRARGYGCGRRSSFNMFSFEKRDILFIGLILVTGAVSLGAYASGIVDAMYFPEFFIEGTGSGLTQLLIYIIYGILCLLPLLIDVSEDLKWKYFRSKI